MQVVTEKIYWSSYNYCSHRIVVGRVLRQICMATGPYPRRTLGGPFTVNRQASQVIMVRPCLAWKWGDRCCCLLPALPSHCANIAEMNDDVMRNCFVIAYQFVIDDNDLLDRVLGPSAGLVQLLESPQQSCSGTLPRCQTVFQVHSHELYWHRLQTGPEWWMVNLSYRQRNKMEIWEENLTEFLANSNRHIMIS